MKLQIWTHPTTEISVYIDQTTKEPYFSQGLICDLLGIDNKSLTKIIGFQGVGNNYSESFEVLTQGGFQGVGNLIKAKDLKTILKAWKPTKLVNKLRKEEVTDKLIDAGAVAYAYTLCGYTLQPKPSIDAIEWIDTRVNGKHVRKDLTNTIKCFVEYARRQGSNSPEHYYKHFTLSCININCIHESQYRDSSIKDKRDRLPATTLKDIILLEDLCMKLLDRYMDEGVHYKEIFRLCKAKMYQYATELAVKQTKLMDISIKKQLPKHEQLSLILGYN